MTKPLILCGIASFLIGGLVGFVISRGPGNNGNDALLGVEPFLDSFGDDGTTYREVLISRPHSVEPMSEDEKRSLIEKKIPAIASAYGMKLDFDHESMWYQWEGHSGRRKVAVKPEGMYKEKISLHIFDDLDWDATKTGSEDLLPPELPALPMK